MTGLQFDDNDPGWLVELARASDSRPELVEALNKCTRAFVRSADYVYFVDNALANRPGAEWQFDRNEGIEGPNDQLVILDLLKDGRVGGVELIFYEGPEKQRLLALGYPRAT